MLPEIQDIAKKAIWTLAAPVLVPILMKDSRLSELLILIPY
jgi:hypothetical protein